MSRYFSIKDVREAVEERRNIAAALAARGDGFALVSLESATAPAPGLERPDGITRSMAFGFAVFKSNELGPPLAFGRTERDALALYASRCVVDDDRDDDGIDVGALGAYRRLHDGSVVLRRVALAWAFCEGDDEAVPSVPWITAPVAREEREACAALFTRRAEERRKRAARVLANPDKYISPAGLAEELEAEADDADDAATMILERLNPNGAD